MADTQGLGRRHYLLPGEIVGLVRVKSIVRKDAFVSLAILLATGSCYRAPTLPFEESRSDFVIQMGSCTHRVPFSIWVPSETEMSEVPPELQRPLLHPRESLRRTGQVELGKASWYDCKRGNRLTASGETFYPHVYAAAHKTLPFGTIVEVTNLSNGKSCRVRINDRGPFITGRIIDLTPRAAAELNMTTEGVVPVQIEVLEAKKVSSD